MNPSQRLTRCRRGQRPCPLPRLILRASSIAAPLLLVAPAVAGVLSAPVHYGGHNYYLLQQSSWIDAEHDAVLRGGHLVTINDSAENDFVFRTFVALLSDDIGLWVGLNDAQEEGVFRWVSGEPVTYVNWALDEPNDWLGIEDYAHFLPKRDGRPDGSWNDAPGSGVWPPLQTLTIPIYGVAEVVPEPATTAGCAVAVVGLVRVRMRRTETGRSRRARAAGRGIPAQHRRELSPSLYTRQRKNEVVLSLPLDAVRRS